MEKFSVQSKSGQQLDMSDCWNRLQYAYENCNVIQYTEGHYGKYENGKLSVCGIGFAMRGAGYTDEEILGSGGNLKCGLKTMFNHKAPSKVLKEYGFSDKERKKFRTCPHSECSYRATLQGVLEHVNEAHKIPIPNIGKMIPIIREHESDVKPTLADHFILLKRDFIDLFRRE